MYRKQLLPVMNEWCKEFIRHINSKEFVFFSKVKIHTPDLENVNSRLLYLSLFLKKHLTIVRVFDHDEKYRHSKFRLFGFFVSHVIDDSFFLISPDKSIVSPIKLDNIFCSNLRFDKILSSRISNIESKLNIESVSPITEEELLTSDDIEEMRLKNIKTWNSHNSVDIFFIDHDGDISHYDEKSKFNLVLFELSSCDPIIRNVVLNDLSLLKRFIQLRLNK
jgi:hypothetical protein